MATVSPYEAWEITGKKDQAWIAEHMGISANYLNLLLNRRRPWNEDMERRFASAVNLSRSVISFAPSGDEQ